MPNVVYQTDQGPKTIKFSATPSASDIDEVAQKQGWKAASSGAATTTPPATPPPTPDQQSAAQYKPTFAANTQTPGAAESLKTIGNIPSSAVQFGKGTIDFMNPVRSVPQALGSLGGIVSSIPGAITDSSEPNYGGKEGQQKTQATAAQDSIIKSNASQAASSGTTAASLLNPVTAEDPSLAKTAAATVAGAGQNLYHTIVPQFFQHLASAGKNYLDAAGAANAGAKEQSTDAGDTALQSAQSTITNDPAGQLTPALLGAEAGSPGIVSDAADTIKAGASKAVGKVADSVRPVSNFAIGEKATNAIANGASKLTGAVTAVPKALLGSEAGSAIDAASNPQGQEFQSGTNSLHQVAAKTADAVGKFVSDSKAQLQAVKASIPDVPVMPETVADAVNQGITNSVKNSADYKGIQGPIITPDDVVNKGVLDPQEAKNVNNMVEFVKNWSDNSARGVLNLKEALDRFHTNGKNPGSDAIVRSVQRSLKGVVGDVAPQIKPALEQASQNIDKADEFQTHLLGSNPATSEAKLRGVATGMNDQARNGYKLQLLGQLKGLTGYDPIAELKGYHDYVAAQSLQRPSIFEPGKMAKYLGTKALIKLRSK